MFLPSSITSAESLHTNLFFLCRPCSICLSLDRDTPFTGASRRDLLCSEHGALDSLEKDLIVQGRSRRTAERHNQVHEIRILCGPLETLSCAHGPADYRSQVSDSEVLRDQSMLRADVIVERASREGSVRRRRCLVRWRRRLPIPEERGDDDEVLSWIQGLVFSNQPVIVRNHFTPCCQRRFIMISFWHKTYVQSTRSGRQLSETWDLRTSCMRCGHL